MPALQYTLFWYPSALDMLSLLSQKAAIRVVLMQEDALEITSHVLRPAPVNDEVDDPLVVQLTCRTVPPNPVEQTQLGKFCKWQMGIIRTAATLLTTIRPWPTKYSLAADINLQIIYVAWAALDWVLKPSKGNAKTSACITALVQLLHRLLMSRSPNLGMTQACCLGVPILLRLLAGSTSHDPNSCDLVTLVLNTLDAKPDMDIAYKDDRLWAALQQLLTVICHDQLKASPEIRRLQLRAVNALLLRDATFQHLTKTHHAQLLHHLAGAYGHLDSTDLKSMTARRPELFQQLQELQA